MQSDNADRGFSFRMDAPLDMRKSQAGVSATDLIREQSENELAQILREYGDVKKAGVIARAIKESQPKTTFALRDLIFNPNDVAPVFQALRIAVNNELGEIESALDYVHSALKTGGRCLCVTFHSIEDRLVKSIFRQWTSVAGDPRMPNILSAEYKKLTTIIPNDDELERNPRERSAHLRAVEKV